MKKAVLFLSLTLCLTLICFTTKAQDNVIKRKGYTLIFLNNDDNLNPALKENLIQTFFEVYPKLEKQYNHKTAKEVTFFVDTAYKGVAATSGGKIVYSAKYFKMHPKDIDVVTHEAMHIVQNYGNTNGPGWLTEGIADYARYEFGVDNAGANWTLPDLQPTHYYNNSYRITARFLVWIEKKVKAGTVKT